VLDPSQDREELVEAALLVGYDNLAGELDGGLAAWQAAGLPTASIPLLDPAADLIPAGSRVLDVRQRGEWVSGHLPGARHAELGTLAGPAADLPEGPIAVMCGHGERAMTGASLLAAGPGGAAAVSVLRGGPGDWAKATGRNLARG
jgi:rhodanese-related sulfurtransferase